MVDEVPGDFTLGIELFCDLVLGADECDTWENVSDVLTHPSADSPYTVVMTVCLTTFRNTLPLAATANDLPASASRLTITLTKSAIWVYTSAGLSPPSRLTAFAPWLSPPSAA